MSDPKNWTESLKEVREAVLRDVSEERGRQDRLWPDQAPGQEHDDSTMLAILTEEVGEISKAILEDHSDAELRKEIIQTAAVCVKWAEIIAVTPGDEEEVPA